MEETVLYKLGKELGEAATSVQNALADRKISLGEGLDIAKEIGTLGYVAVKNYEVLEDQVKNGLDVAEEADFKAGFNDGYDLSNDASEAAVEAAFGGAVMVINGIAKMFIKDD